MNRFWGNIFLLQSSLFGFRNLQTQSYNEKFAAGVVVDFGIAEHSMLIQKLECFNVESITKEWFSSCLTN